MRHKGLIISLVVVILIGGAFCFGMLVYLLSGGSADFRHFGVTDGVGLVTVEGQIISADDIIRDIDDFRKDDGIKSVVLRIESPGGSIGASQEILEAVSMLSQKKPVVASMGSVAASGGYYVACGATKILANPGTVTGSIGVRLEHIMVEDLLKWAKVRHETLKSGRFKDLASFDRPMTPEERAILQGMLDDMHLQFKEVVAKTRNLDMEKVNELADGRVYTGRQALDLKLVDELGGLAEALKLAGSLGGIKGDPEVIRPKKRLPFLERFFDSTAKVFIEKSSAVLDYWQPFMMMTN